MTVDDKVMAITQWLIHIYTYMFTQFRTWEWEELYVHVAAEKWLG